MISSVKGAIAVKLLELYPAHKIYDENIPQGFKTPCFIVSLIDQDYSKRNANRFKSLLSFDVAYHSNKGTSEIKRDCQTTQVALFRAFDAFGTFRAQNKQATIVDNVLHFTFDVPYSELKEEPFVPMQTQETNTNL
ncbi:MAG: DUF6838 family protein [Desulfitobacterium sp.]